MAIPFYTLLKNRIDNSEIYDSTFTNGAHYLHKQINFYLKRQDPDGTYGLRATKDNFGQYGYAELEIEGNTKDISDGDYFEPGENNIC